MKRAYVFRDEKVEKFWTIHTGGGDLCVNFGKCGTIGKYQIKECGSEDGCRNEADKLIRQKCRKGYAEDTGFDFDSRVYIDDEAVGPHRLTSHPRFTAHFTEDFYYDCTDEFAPFGSDEGADALEELGQRIRKNPGFDFAAFPRRLVEEVWEMAYLAADDLDPAAVEAVAARQEREMLQSDMVTFAVAFAQIKMTGRIGAKLKDSALNALRRFKMMTRDARNVPRMIRDLEAFPIAP